jgi:hypothetical protein
MTGEIVIPRTARNDKILDVSQRHADVNDQIRDHPRNPRQKEHDYALTDRWRLVQLDVVGEREHAEGKQHEGGRKEPNAAPFGLVEA